MNKHKCVVLLAMFVTPLLCSAETWSDASIVDANCSAKVKDNPDAHTRDCANAMREIRLRHSHHRRHILEI